jgi:hypothetical protein
MSELTLIAERGGWTLVDEDEVEIGRFPSRDEALTAAADYALAVGQEPAYLLIQSEDGEWEEAEAPVLH